MFAVIQIYMESVRFEVSMVVTTKNAVFWNDAA
jgi:hypothetical protein